MCWVVLMGFRGEEDGENFLCELNNFIENYANNKLSSKANQYMSFGSLIALEKENGVRPIAMGEYDRKLAGSNIKLIFIHNYFSLPCLGSNPKLPRTEYMKQRHTNVPPHFCTSTKKITILFLSFCRMSTVTGLVLPLKLVLVCKE